MHVFLKGTTKDKWPCQKTEQHNSINTGEWHKKNMGYNQFNVEYNPFSAKPVYKGQKTTDFSLRHFVLYFEKKRCLVLMCPASVPELGKSPECGQSFGQTFSKDDEGRGTKQRVLF